MINENNERWRKFASIWKEPVPDVGQTPRHIVWKKNKASLFYYPSKKKKYNTPLFFVYSLVNQAFILDLGPGYSLIESFTKEGYDVYLLDFGTPRYEDKDITLDDYIEKFIKKAVREAVRHAQAEEITIIGYCLGGTLATIYTALAEEPIKNLVLFATPLDFSKYDNNLIRALKKGELHLDPVIDSYGVIPAEVMELVLRMATSPISLSQYVALYERADDEEYVKRWRRFYSWVNGHVPFVGATLKQLLDMVKENKLIRNQLRINGKHVNLRTISCNLLVISTEDDELIPEPLITPIMDSVSSKDKTYKRIKGGHVSVAIKGRIPSVLANWLHDRS